jgi:hypothetical protein
MMWPTWVLTVASEMCNSAAISAFDRPEPTSASTSRVPLAYLRELCDYWADGYDWRATEARLN